MVLLILIENISFGFRNCMRRLPPPKLYFTVGADNVGRVEFGHFAGTFDLLSKLFALLQRRITLHAVVVQQLQKLFRLGLFALATFPEMIVVFHPDS